MKIARAERRFGCGIEPERVWTRITSAENIPPREGRCVNVGALEIPIFNLNGRFLTIENQCPHKGGPLCDGIVSGATVVCPLHGWRIDLESGFAVLASSPASVRTFSTRIEDGVILVDLGGEPAVDREQRPQAATR